jgi:hypothetical protein
MIKAEFAKLTMRGALTPRYDPCRAEGVLLDRAAFRDGNTFAAKFAGKTP